MKFIPSFFLNLIYPKRCPVCDEPFHPSSNLCCKECEGTFPLLCSPLCVKCGRQIEGKQETFCKLCKTRHFSFDRGFSMWNYDHIGVKQSIYRFKYRTRKEYAPYYARELLQCFPFLFSPSFISAILPVPIHKNRKRTRGYNQSEVLAFELSKLSGLPVITDLLIRKKNTAPQNQLSDKSRRENLKDAFEVNPSSPFYSTFLSSILLIDDIYTTGSTADICSSVLKKTGVSKVYVLCLSSIGG